MLTKLLIFTIASLTLVLQLNTCAQRKKDEKVEWGGPNKTTHLVVFFKKDASYEQIEDFNKNVLSKPHPQGNGYYMKDGIAFLFRLHEGSYEGVGINFSTDATPEQREQLKKTIQESPIIYKVYENAVPSEADVR
jgi:hypothetical protein